MRRFLLALGLTTVLTTPAVAQTLTPVPLATLSSQLLAQLRGQNYSGVDLSSATASALGGTSPRPMTAHFGDEINVKDHHAVCDGVTDDTAGFNEAIALATNPLRVAGGSVYVPAGTCRISGSIGGTVGGTQGLRLHGSGMFSTILLFDGNGPTLASTSQTAQLEVADIDLRHNSSTSEAGIGLALSDTTSGTATLLNVQLDGVQSAGSWLEAIRSVNIAPFAFHVNTLLPSVASASNTVMSYGLHILGTLNSDGSQIFALDGKVIGSVFEGGQAGIKVEGPEQGLWVDGSEFLGGNYGIYWHAVPGDSAEMLKVHNPHFNEHLGSVSTVNVGQVEIAGGYMLHYGCNGDGFTNIEVTQASATISQTLFNGCSGSNVERGIVLHSTVGSTVFGNSGVSMSGPEVDVSDNNPYASVTGNTTANLNGTSPAYVGATNAQLLGNNWNGVPDFNDNGTTETVNRNLSLGTHTLAVQGDASFNNLFVANGSSLYLHDSSGGLGQFLALGADNYIHVNSAIAGVAPTVVSQNGIFTGNLIVAPTGSNGVTIGSDGTITAAGAAKAASLQTKVLTVSTLPSCGSAGEGLRSAVSDATSPSFLGTLVGGGTVHVSAYCNGTHWIAQ